MNPTTNRVYIANSHRVTVVDGATQGVIATVPLADEPTGVIQGVGVNAATDRIYVSIGGRFVSVIDGATQALVATVPVECAGGLAVNPVSNRVYISNYCSNAVSVVDGATDTEIVSVRVGAYPLAMEVNLTTNQIYVANRHDGTVSVIDGLTNTVSATVDAGAQPAGLAVNATTNRVYVTHYPDYAYLSVIDGATNTAGTVPLSSPVIGISVSPVTGRIYLASYLSDSVFVLDGATHALMATIPVAAGSLPWAIAVNPVTDLVYVTQMWDQRNVFGTVSVIADPQASSTDAPNDVISQGNATDNAAGGEKSLNSKLSVTPTASLISIDATTLSATAFSL
ncbi:MAG: YncE family protein, partial [Acidobacteria bacterium]|nr:YncE family protein [Acidobacteriota bacterium]